MTDPKSHLISLLLALQSPCTEALKAVEKDINVARDANPDLLCQTLLQVVAMRGEEMRGEDVRAFAVLFWGGCEDGFAVLLVLF